MAEARNISVFGEVKDGSVSFASGSGVKVVETDLATYNALATKDADTLYVITALEPSSSS